MHKFLSASLTLALAAPFCASAQSQASSASEIQLLRQEIDAMRATYEARLQAMEQRLQTAERIAAAPAPVVVADRLPAPVATRSVAGANAFNPAISLILSGGYTQTSLDPASYAITGIQLPAGSEAGPGPRGFNLAESELGLSANIDPWLRGAASIALHPDNTLSIEEAFIQTTSLGNGLSLKAGRFFSGVGYLNSQHSHSWDFVDNPLAYQAFLGTQYADDGVQLHWLAPIDQYLELGLELGRGLSFPGSDTGGNGAGMSALTLHTGGDLGESHSWRAGVSWLTAKAADQGLTTLGANGSLISSTFTGTTQVWVIDGVWKWAPNGNATHTNFKLQGEYLQSSRSGSLVYDTSNTALADSYSALQSGWYLQAVYQFMPNWRLGLRTERLNTGAPDYGANTGLISASSYQPSKNTLMLDYNPSEFSRLRLQLAQDKSREGLTDKQLFLQYQMSLGAHGAHSY
jgi:hypothetical protein